MAQYMRWIGKFLILLGCVGYPLLAHLAVMQPQTGPMRLVLAIIPLVALAIWAARRPNKYFWFLTGLAIASGIYILLVPARVNIAAVYGIPHAAINLFLFWLFGRTLLRGQEALITRVARRVHGALPQQLEIYTRQVTIAWCIFFAAQIIISILLFIFAPIATWSFYINFLDLPLVALMFLAEYAYRITCYRSHPHTPIWKTVQAFTKDFSSSEGADAR